MLTYFPLFIQSLICYIERMDSQIDSNDTLPHVPKVSLMKYKNDTRKKLDKIEKNDNDIQVISPSIL